jgi:hypothetical protein
VSAVAQTDPPWVEMEGFKLTHPERGQKLQISGFLGGYAAFMANKLMVQEEEAIRNLTALGWGIRRIARELLYGAETHLEKKVSG